MSHKTPLWVLRNCCACHNYAHAECQAWIGDTITGELCRNPICDRHAYRQGNIVLCPEHSHRKGAATCETWKAQQLNFNDIAY